MGLRIKNNRWEYRFRVNGQKVREATGLEATERNRKKAEQMETAHRTAILEGRLGIRRITPKFFNDGAEEFILHQRAVGRKESTVKRIETSLASLKVFFDKQLMNMISEGNVGQYIAWRLSEHKVKPVTVKHDVDNLSLVFQWGVRMRYARENPVINCEDKPSDKDAVRMNIVSPADERLYFSHAKGNLRDVARLILLQGARPDEVMSMAKADVDLAAGTWSIPKGKTAAARRTLKLMQESRSIIAARIGTLGPWVFGSSKRTGEHISKLNCPHDRLLEKTGLRFVLYDLRHTFATRMVEAGVDLAVLKDIMGHVDIRITQRYVHPTKESQFRAMGMYEQSILEREKGLVQ